MTNEIWDILHLTEYSDYELESGDWQVLTPKNDTQIVEVVEEDKEEVEEDLFGTLDAGGSIRRHTEI